MERISANLLGPGIVRARPPNPTHLTTKAAQMLETLEARLAAQSEALFPELRPALPTGPRSFPTPRLPSTTKPPASLSRTGAPKPPPAAKSVNLPSWKKITIDIDHTSTGHIVGGFRTMCKGSKKTLFPEGITKPQLERIIRHAYKNGRKVKTQEGGKVVVIGEYEGMKIKMHVNVKTKTIETAYPKK